MNPKVLPIVDKNIDQQIYKIIAEQIISGGMKPGTRITEKEIGSLLGVSRTPVREAMKALSKDGLIELIPHKCAVVRKLSRLDIAEIFEVRAVLEGLAARLAAKHIPKRELAKLKGRRETSRDELYKGKVNLFVESDIYLHSLILEYCGNKYLQKTLRSLHNLIHYFRVEIAKNVTRSIEAFNEHTRILMALEKQDADLAEAAMKDHISFTRERTLKDIDFSNDSQNEE
jgi:DNA-binding GntR family transcriptional regulator